jgi:hypothetical protein
MAWATEETDEVLAPWPGPGSQVVTAAPGSAGRWKMVEAAIDSGHWAAEAA